MARRAEDLPLLMDIMAGDNRHKLQLDKPVRIEDIRVSLLFNRLQKERVRAP